MKAKLPTVFLLLVSSLSCVAAGCVSVSLRVSGVSCSRCLPRGISPPTKAGSLGCSGPGPPRTPTTATRVSPVSPPVFRPATHQLVTDVWLGCSLWVEACQWLQGATGGKHVVVPPQLLGAASLPSPGASHDPAQAQQPHARGCRLVLAALKVANPVTAVGVVISTTGMAMAKREGAA